MISFIPLGERRVSETDSVGHKTNSLSPLLVSTTLFCINAYFVVVKAPQLDILLADVRPTYLCKCDVKENQSWKIMANK